MTTNLQGSRELIYQYNLCYMPHFEVGYASYDKQWHIMNLKDLFRVIQLAASTAEIFGTSYEIMLSLASSSWS